MILITKQKEWGNLLKKKISFAFTSIQKEKEKKSSKFQLKFTLKQKNSAYRWGWECSPAKTFKFWFLFCCVESQDSIKN